MAKQIITILNYNMQHQKNQQQYLRDKYHRQLAQKLSDPCASSKTYWSILKGFYNGRTVAFIPPLLINNKLESLLQNVLPLLTIVLHPIHYMFLMSGFPYFLSMRQSY